MTDYLEQLKDTYRQMDTEEIAERVKGGTLTDQAHAVALQELRDRGARLDALPSQPLDMPGSVDPQQNFLVRVWSGKERLWIVFWVLGFLLNIPLGMAAAIRHPLLSVALYAIGVLCRLFWLDCVWRSAFRSSHWTWAILARVYVVVDLAISALILFWALT